jgi:hypothetical protein
MTALGIPMMPDPHPLPEARLRPQNGADHKTILRGHAATGARRAGRFAWALTKLGAVIGVLALGVAAMGSRNIHSSFDRQSESLRRMNESLRRIQSMPKIDFKSLDFTKGLDYRLRSGQLEFVPASSFDPELVYDTERDLSPSQQRARR